MAAGPLPCLSIKSAVTTAPASGAPRKVTLPERSAAEARRAVNSRTLMNTKALEVCIAYLLFWTDIVRYGAPGLKIERRKRNSLGGGTGASIFDGNRLFVDDCLIIYY